MWKLATLLVLALGSSDTLSVRLTPSSLFADGTILLTCHVPRQATNRRLRAALLGYTYSDRDLAGEQSALTYRFTFKHVPCGVEQGACIVTDAYDHQREAVAPVVVAGCEP
jgi:hypothetical protein